MSTNLTALITIGITCFNAEDTIEEAVSGALKQNWKNFEIIIVDDCSTDSSAQKLQSISEKDKRIRVIKHEKNKGFPSALNTIVKNAQGEFIALFDDDDISRSDRLKAQYGRITKYEKIHSADMILCYSNRAIQRPNDSEPKHAGYAIGRKAQEPYGTMVADYIFLYSGHSSYTWGLFGSCTLMARTEVYQKIGMFDASFRRSAEWDFAIRAAFMNTHFIAVDEPLILQVKTISSDKSEKISQHYKVQLRKKYKAYLKKKNAYLASLTIAYAGNQKNRLKYLITRSISILFAPHIFILKNRKNAPRPPHL